MTDIILHHYDISPDSKKVRTGLGLKGLAWASFELSVIMPKPNLTALTGGYRKTPVLQIGADIYWDSQLIMRELERRFPTPSFYPAGHGAADALAWAEKTTFSPAVSIAFAKRPEGFLEDRAKFSGRNIVRQNFGSVAPPLDGFPRLLTWAERIAAIVHGSRSQMSAQQALDVARDATSIARATVDPRIP
jgi:glutathione S-transferase